MECPICNVTLLLSERQGVEIDYCPQCRGIWLDRGELEKLIELSQAVALSHARTTSRPAQDGSRSDHYADRREESNYQRDRPKRRESWLSNLFDFD
ncbi:zf-TFIIB domain-containing protein [Bremerella sp.]|uniref:TFIIB-type zinc ribbon-containing protein n=1 Tax=Bremerella sp. TaxID=2795602 RepID=UPI00391B545F